MLFFLFPQLSHSLLCVCTHHRVTAIPCRIETLLLFFSSWNHFSSPHFLFMHLLSHPQVIISLSAFTIWSHCHLKVNFLLFTTVNHHSLLLLSLSSASPLATCYSFSFSRSLSFFIYHLIYRQSVTEWRSNASASFFCIFLWCSFSSQLLFQLRRCLNWT